jgi:hypothetical protein
MGLETYCRPHVCSGDEMPERGLYHQMSHPELVGSLYVSATQ